MAPRLLLWLLMNPHRSPPDDGPHELERYYRAVAPWMDPALMDRGDVSWWRGAVERVGAHRVVELGCGTGRVTAALACDGRRVVGLDRVEAMLTLARKRLAGRTGLHLVRGDLRRPPLRAGAWDLVAAPDDPFIHLVDDADRQRALDAAARLLAPGGRLVLDLLWWTPREVEEARSPTGLYRTQRVELEGGVGTLEVAERWKLAPDGRTVAARYRYLPPRGEAVTASFRGRRWTLPELRERLGAAGLEVTRMSGDYEDGTFDPERARALLVEAGFAGGR